MRVVFFVLLAGNLAFLAWSQWIDRPPQATSLSSTRGLPQLELASERGRGDAEAAPQTPVPISPPEQTLPGDDSSPSAVAAAECAEIGPFTSQAQAEQAMATLRTRGFEPRQRARTSEVAESFWVHIDGLANAAEERRVLGRLRGSGIDDASVMPDSDEGRRISVGIFRERARAERRAEGVRRLGLSPEITPRNKSADVYWIEIARTPGTAVATDGLSGDDAQALEVETCKTPGA